MPSSASPSIWYVYGVVPSSAATGAGSAAPPESAGLDEAPVEFEVEGHAAALVSVLRGPDYEPDAVETNGGDVDWVGPRAVAHDRVLTWASDRGPVVPMPMFSLFSGRDAVHAMLRDRAAALGDALARAARGREYALRVFRVDAEMLSAVARLSPKLRELAAAAAAAAPGQRYLLERKLDAARRGEMRGVTREVVESIVADLGRHAVETARPPIPRTEAPDGASSGTMVLNAAFLIAPDSLAGFQKTLTNLVEEHGANGLRFDFTGPWPPYHFVGGVPDGR
ncbi:MAG: GvpL/GvpF family gas vesicle protein [Gemmatimonadales bacterium]